MANARPTDALSKLSAALTMATLAGLAGIACVALPAKLPVKFAGASAGAQAAGADVMQKQSQAEITLVAAKPSKSKADESPPKSTWDGTPQHRQGDAKLEKPADKSAEKPAMDKSDGKATEPATTNVPAQVPSEKPADAAAVPSGPPAPVAPVVEEWSPTEIAAALKECVKLLGPVAAEIEPVDAMRKGPCGAPAPVLLKSIGTTERIDFTPPVEINCALAVKLADWAEKVLQPAARKLLSARVTKISGASGYQCRNRYGLANAPLSEHALANAVDIPGFVLADGRTIKVKSGWGPTARDLVAKADPDKKATPDASGKNSNKPDKAEKAEPPEKANPNDNSGKKDKTADGKVPRPSDIVGKSGDEKMKLAALKGGAYQKLGAGPTVTTAQAPVAAPAVVTMEGKFLRELSKGACQTFGTVLGPEANEAHRDHFHFDIKARRKAAFCQ